MAGSMWTMPIIVINMGGEMVYILHQRLQAQAVQEDKSRKVLQDVVRAMYSPLFITELFKPQEMYSMASTKQIFEKLAHSSIMRLNKSSMEKLYDLMTMGFKFQVVTCNSPHQLLHVTLTHLEALKKIVKSEKVEELIDVAIAKSLETFANLTNGQWMLLKQSLMRFLQGKKIKVSLFLQQGLQAMDGTLILDPTGKLPFGSEIPGVCRYYEGRNLVSTKIIHALGSDEIPYEETDEVMDMTSTLGHNMYSKDAAAEAKASFPESAQEASRIIAASIGVYSNTKVKRQGITQKTAKAELSMLSDLLGMSSASEKESESKPFKINLFPDYSNSKSEGKDSGDTMIVIDIDATADSKTYDAYMRDLKLDDDDAEYKSDAKGGDGDDEDDLLALMDSAK